MNTKKMKLKLLLILALLPVSTISIAATAKASELENDLQNEKMLNQLRVLRNKMIASDKLEANLNDAIIRYQSQTGYYGMDLKENFHADLKLLVEKGIIQMSNEGVIGGAPSDGT